MEAIRPKRTLVDETYDALVDAICSGELLPGERLNQDEIADRLNVSRQPVNSAISILKANRLVEDTGRRGVIISPLDPDLFRSIFEYRLVIEPFAVRLACERLPGDADRRMAPVLKRGEQASKSGDIRALLEADQAFHETIYEWSGNQVIGESMRVNWHHIRRTMAEVLREPANVGPIWDEHRAIFQALLACDAERAARLMEDHMSHAYQRNFPAVEGGRGAGEQGK